ncbi:hypothetical protein CC2G_005887 [Coprinopsis cinerea AmutBmut pab1-1]|nr:hypothetical protein CC2G_005887 [Coprinopsis cinerea AmutBmut pab1-1]
MRLEPAAVGAFSRDYQASSPQTLTRATYAPFIGFGPFISHATKTAANCLEAGTGPCPTTKCPKVYTALPTLAHSHGGIEPAREEASHGLATDTAEHAGRGVGEK